jgi:hypothetical protein
MAAFCLIKSIGVNGVHIYVEQNVCVCVCVRVFVLDREREREREIATVRVDSGESCV